MSFFFNLSLEVKHTSCNQLGMILNMNRLKFEFDRFFTLILSDISL